MNNDRQFLDMINALNNSVSMLKERVDQNDKDLADVVASITALAKSNSEYISAMNSYSDSILKAVQAINSRVIALEDKKESSTVIRFPDNKTFN